MTEQNGRAEILRAAGHGDAADLLDAIDRASAMRVVEEVDQPQPAPEPQRQPTGPEAARQAEGEVLLAALRRDIPTLFEDQ